jgi:hypothetical protein
MFCEPVNANGCSESCQYLLKELVAGCARVELVATCPARLIIRSWFLSGSREFHFLHELGSSVVLNKRARGRKRKERQGLLHIPWSSRGSLSKQPLRITSDGSGYPRASHDHGIRATVFLVFSCLGPWAEGSHQPSKLGG